MQQEPNGSGCKSKTHDICDNAIFASIGGLFSKTLSEKLYTLLKNNARAIDLFLHIPHCYENIYNRSVGLTHNSIGQKVIVPITVQSHVGQVRSSLRYTGRKVYRVITSTNIGETLELMFFNIFPSQIAKLAPGTHHVITGKLESSNLGYKIIHPQIQYDANSKLSAYNKTPLSLNASENDNMSEESDIQICPIYKLSAELSQKQVSDAVKKITTIIKSATIPEWLSESTINAYKLPSFYEAVNTLHNPKCAKHVAMESASMRRLIYDELLASQISLQLARNKRSNIDGMTISSNGNLIAILKKSLPFVITHAQHSVIEDIIQDQARHRPMFRLLQGDVGSGKTLVALIAMLNTIDAGKKAALMAPTTILASQHYHWITSITSNMNVNVAILTSSSTTKERREILHKIQNKKIDILIGTHAITNEDIQLKNFGLIVIDEQHRFGVKQRAMLFMQSSNADILMMTATPIPRTLAMSIYGDIDISIISDKPSNRKAVDTRMISSNKMDSLLQAIERALNGNEKIFWICATIEESDHIDLTAATNRYKDLNSRFGEIVGLLHGRMTEADSISVMKKFLQSEIRLLVSTTVIEIGVDIPDATIIVIEQAERFGLAQLHQLRGRVGRSDKQSYCFLLYSNNISISAKQRIKVIRDSNDGFYIAEKDMRIRGGGSILGVQQSGFGEFKFANLSRDSDLLYLAQKEAYKALQNDSHLLSERGAALQLLLRIFNQESAVDAFLKG